MSFINTENVSEYVKKEIESWQSFLEVYTSLFPGGVGAYVLEGNKFVPVYVSRGVFDMCIGFEDDFYEKMREDTMYMLVDGEAEKLKKAAKIAAENHLILDIKLQYKKTPKELGWCWIRGRIFPNVKERNFVCGMILDLTEKKHLEEQVQIQNERYHILEETTNEMLFEIDVNSGCMSFSVRQPDGELIRKRVPKYLQNDAGQTMVHPDYLKIFREHLKIALEKKTNGTLEYLSKITTGGYEWHRNYYASIADETGKVVGVVGRVQNVHDEVLNRQKRNEQFADGVYSFSGVQKRIHDSLENADFDDTHAMAIISVNHFKQKIGQHGVAWGDVAMRTILQVTETILGDSALYGRVDDGRILIYFLNVPDDELDKKMKNILSRLEHSDYKIGDHNIRCTVALATVQGVADYTTMYHEVEEALHIAKITKGKQYVRI